MAGFIRHGSSGDWLVVIVQQQNDGDTRSRLSGYRYRAGD